MTAPPAAPAVEGGAAASELVERVRDWLAGRPGELTPHRVASALRDAGRRVGDATVLAVYEAPQRHRRPAARAAAPPAGA